MPEKMGLRIPEMLDMAVYGKLKAMYVMGEDPALTDADANHVRKALDSLEFLVAQNLFMTETAKYADVFLPAACYAEKDGTFTNTERRVQRVRKAVEPPGQCRPDWQIIADLSCRLGHEMHYDSPEEIFDEMRTLVPQYAGITYERIDKVGLQWPCPDDRAPGHAGSCTPAASPAARACCRASSTRRRPSCAATSTRILLTTGRMLYHYNIMTRHSANLEALRPHELAQINPLDAERLGLGEGDMARVTLAARLDHDARDGHRHGARGRRVHDLPLQGIAGQRAHQLGLRPGHQDGRVQGLRGAHRKGARDRPRRAPRRPSEPRRSRRPARPRAAVRRCGTGCNAVPRRRVPHGTRRLVHTGPLRAIVA